MPREYKRCAFKADRYDDEQGIFEGYASVFGNIDSGEDIVEPGAFSDTLRDDFHRMKILTGHNSDLLPIGKPLEMREDERGLYIKAQISDTQTGRDVKTLLRDGVLTELSIGFDVHPSDVTVDSDGVRHLHRLKLWEVSVVTWAMNSRAVITDYKTHAPPDTPARPASPPEPPAPPGQASQSNQPSATIPVPARAADPKAARFSYRKPAGKPSREKSAANLKAQEAAMRKRTNRPKGRKNNAVSPELVDAVVKTILENQAEEEALKDEEPASESIPIEVTSEELAELMAEAANAAALKRKTRKETDEAIDDQPTGDEVAAELAKLLRLKSDANAEDEEEKDEDEDAREEGTDFPNETPAPQKRRRAPSGRKSAHDPGQSSSIRYHQPPLERKYVDVFMSAPSETAAPGEEKNLSPYAKLARAVKCSNWSHGDPDRAAYFARNRYGDSRLERSYKALNTINPSEGGYMIPEVYADEVIELLYAKTFLFELGARKVSMPNGTITFPGMLRGSNATWSGELRSIQATQPAYRSIKMTAKKLSALIPMSNEFLMFNSYANDEIYGADLVKRIAEKMEYGALFGEGGEFHPLGILKAPEVTTIDIDKISDATLVNGSHITASLFPVIQAAAMKNNINTDKLGWVFNPQVYAEILNAASPLGDYTYRYEMSAKGTLMGAPYRVTTLLPVSEAKTSTIIYANWSDVLVGDVEGLRIETFREGAAHDADGKLYSAVEQDGLIMRAVMYTDIALRHPQSVVAVKNVKLSYDNN